MNRLLSLCAAPLRVLAPLALALLLLSAFGTPAQVFRYREQTGDEVAAYVSRVEPGAWGYTVIHQQDGETLRSQCRNELGCAMADSTLIAWRLKARESTTGR